MFTIDSRLRGLPAARDQVVSVFQSINQPHLAIPGKRAGPAQAFIVGLRGSAGLSVFVYLHLPETQDCAVYVPERRNLSAEEYAGAEGDAQAFVESMGFIMDNLNFRAQPQPEQDQMLKSLPVFLRDPRLAAPSPAQAVQSPQKEASPNDKLGRLFASF